MLNVAKQCSCSCKNGVDSLAAVWAVRIIGWCCCIGSDVAYESADSMQKIDVDEAVVAAVLSEARLDVA